MIADSRYVAGSSLGGFCGSFIPGVLDDLIGWRSAFLALAVFSLAGAVMVMLLLPVRGAASSLLGRRGDRTGDGL